MPSRQKHRLKNKAETTDDCVKMKFDLLNSCIINNRRATVGHFYVSTGEVKRASLSFLKGIFRVSKVYGDLLVL